MLRISKLTDYALVVIGDLSTSPPGPVPATEIAERTGLPLPTVSKLLKLLAAANVVVAVRGKHGGYQLTATPGELPVLQIVDAIEGPIAITACSADGAERCDYEGNCRVGRGWRRINVKIRGILASISVADMLADDPALIELGVRVARRPLDAAGA